AILSQLSNGLSEEGVFVLRAVAEIVRQAPMGTAKGSQHLAGMKRVKEIDKGRVPAFQNLNLQGFHEPTNGEPKIVPHHDDTKDTAAVAVPQSLHQLRGLFIVPGVEPLLELVQHQ